MAVLSCVPGTLCLTQPPAMTRARQCLCRRPQNLCSRRRSSLQGFSRTSVLVQPDSNLLLTPSKMTCYYFQAISGICLRSSKARHYGEALHRAAAAGAGRCACLQRHACLCKHAQACDTASRGHAQARAGTRRHAILHTRGARCRNAILEHAMPVLWSGLGKIK